MLAAGRGRSRGETMRIGPWWLLCAALLAPTADAVVPQGSESQYLQQLPSEPKEAAKALGALRSARGLQAIIEAGKPELLNDYENGLSDRRFSQYPEQRTPMPAEMERI